jgi:hypothetical protein|tara:strand:- start:1263 stop:1427 length:165 start_codon:yes stop_codon:yes gene_type:complete
VKKSDKEKEEYTSIHENWKDVNWDAVQRMRFMNWDAEVDPDDSFSKKWKKERDE